MDLQAYKNHLESPDSQRKKSYDPAYLHKQWTCPFLKSFPNYCHQIHENQFDKVNENQKLEDWT